MAQREGRYCSVCLKTRDFYYLRGDRYMVCGVCWKKLHFVRKTSN